MEHIVPLGLIHPPGHALPMDHILLLLPNGPGGKTKLKTDIRAPGIVRIFGIRSVIYKRDGVVESKIYSIAFTPCRELTFYFEAINDLSDSLHKEIELQKCEPNSQKEGNREFLFCEYLVDYVTKAGEIIGTAGGLNGSNTLDWGSYDMRVPKLPFLGRGDEGPNNAVFYTTCPLNYYSSSLKDQLYDKLSDPDGQKRTAEPRCGEIMQDKFGTIQGNWQTKKEFRKDGDTTWSPFMGIGHDNYNASKGIIGVAGTISNSGTINYEPEHNGTINRESSEVTADGKIYCYQNNRRSNDDTALSGRLLIQLLDPKTLKAEYQEKKCDEVFKFVSPTIYER
ncbi:hypothetical protein HYU23_02850 [Candidatus Woesearchaeota archaeon]|nr:hypothetical protein [Candidatus Woesearchaeota archaeon]